MKKTFAILGCGFLGGIVAEAWRKGLLPDYQLVGVCSRQLQDAEKLSAGAGAAAPEEQILACTHWQNLLPLHPDFLIETASVALLKEAAIPFLEQGTSIVPLSIGAFSDDSFYEALQQAARKGNARVHIPSGAVGGFDVLQTVSLMAQAEGKSLRAGIHTHKGPASLRGTTLYQEHLLTDSQETTVFQGTAAEAIQLLPTKVNVAVATALATAGPQHTEAAVTSVPDFRGDDHCITAETEGIRAVVDIYSATSAIAGWSIVALLRNLSSPVVFY